MGAMPNWTISDLARFKQRRSDAQGRRDVYLAGVGQAPQLEQNPGHPLHGSLQAPAPIRGTNTIRFTSVRKRPLDPDDICEKYVIDVLRRLRDPSDPAACIIPGDAPTQLNVEHFQRKPQPNEGEYFVIEIF
jgi:hypothetical protein